MPQSNRAEAIKKLSRLIKGIKFAMLTTHADDGTLRSRPMTMQEEEFDGDLWFFVGADAQLVREIQRDAQINLAFANPESQAYVSVSGSAHLVRDAQKVKQLWKPIYKAWFPEGSNDPNLALLKVEVSGAEYWDSPHGAVVQILGFAKALVTGQRYSGGESERLTLNH